MCGIRLFSSCFWGEELWPLFFLGGGGSTPRGLFACCLFIALRGCLFNVFSLILVLDVSAVLSAVIYSR